MVTKLLICIKLIMLSLISNVFHMKLSLNIGPFRLRKIVVKFIKENYAYERYPRS